MSRLQYALVTAGMRKLYSAPLQLYGYVQGVQLCVQTLYVPGSVFCLYLTDI